MHLARHSLLMVALAGTALAGCTTTSGPRIYPYRAADPAQPSAQLTIQTQRLFRHDVKCQPDGTPSSELMSLANWSRSSPPVGPAVVTLPAERVYFQYGRDEAKETCSINFSAKLEAGHAYLIGTRQESHWLKGTSCMLLMIDAETGAPVQLDLESAYPDFRRSCRKRLGLAGKPLPN